MRVKGWIALAACVLACGLSVSAMAAKQVESNNGQFFSARHLIGLSVYDSQNQKVGKVDNLVIDAHSGHVLYGILHTGLVGKYIPIPCNAARMEKKANETEFSFVLNKTKDELNGAPTVDRGHWPDFTDRRFQETIAQFFGVPNKVRVSSDQRVEGHLTPEQMIFGSSNLVGLNVYDEQNQKLGKLDDLILDTHEGQVVCAILDTGMRGKDITVPWNAFRLEKQQDADRYWLVLNKTPEQLANAPTFDPNQWPNFADQQWRQSVDQFFGVRVATRPEPTEPQR
jgi:sporulation protein YlmC with PRC-barrel domain